jgi:hypothetical protein
MVLRSLAAFVVRMAAMGFVTAPWHLWRCASFRESSPATGALAGDGSGRRRTDGAVDWARADAQHSVRRWGQSSARAWSTRGLRNSFIVTAGFYLVAFVLMLVVYVEPEQRHLRLT